MAAAASFAFLIFLVLAVVFGLVLHKTAIGRQLFAIGTNPVAARFSGIPVERLRFMLFVLSGHCPASPPCC